MKTLNLTNFWSVLALNLIIVRAVVTYQSAARPGNESNSNTAKLFITGGQPGSTRRFFFPRSAGAPPAVRQEEQRSNIQPSSFNGPDVSVTCSASDIVVRVKPTFYGLFADKEELKLGDTCLSNGVLRPYGDLLFTYPLTACGAVRQPASHHVAYKFVLHYEPSVRSWPKIDVDIVCRYPRNYHVSKLIVQPTWKTAVMHKRLKGLSKNFHIELMDDSWSQPAGSRVYQLGSQINFQVSAFYLPHGAKVYISSCFAAPASSSGSSSQKYIVIDNSGCLLDSQRMPGLSQFISQSDDTVRFSLRAFQFVSEPEIALKFQCQLLVTFEDPSPAHKSCTYVGNRWEALSGDDSICECCDSQCVTSKRRRDLMKGSATSQLLMVSEQLSIKEEGLSSIMSTSSRISRDGESASSFDIKDLQSRDSKGGTDLALHGKYEDDQDDQYDGRSHLDLDKQGDRGELLVENNKSTVTRVLFKNSRSGYSLDEDISKGEGKEFEGENGEGSQPEQVQKLSWKKIEDILQRDINQTREQKNSEELEEIREHEEEEGNGRMFNSEVELRNGEELDGDGLMTWYFW